MRLLVSTLFFSLNLCVSKDIRAYDKVFEDLNLDISSFPETLEIRYGNGLNFKTPGSILDPQLTDELRRWVKTRLKFGGKNIFKKSIRTNPNPFAFLHRSL